MVERVSKLPAEEQKVEYGLGGPLQFSSDPGVYGRK